MRKKLEIAAAGRKTKTEQYINKLLKIFKTECNICVLNIFMLY